MMALSRTLLMLLACGVLLQCGGPPPPQQQPPNIVLITADTLRADHLGCYGYFRDTSPVIDALAAEGLLFERAYAPMSTTLPSHISLMTSLNPLQHGVLGNFLHLKTALATSDDLHTAAQLLSRSGYATAAFVSCAPLKSHSGIAAGFEVYDEPETPLRSAEETIGQALQWLAGHDERPMFLWVHLFDAHQPYRPPPEFAELFAADDERLAQFLKARNVPAQERVLASNTLYDGEIRYLDSQLGRLLDALKARGLYDDAALVFTADHGEGLGQHGWMDHGPIYEEDLHVPLILKLPRAINRPGERRQDLAALIDIWPTLVANLDLPVSEEERAQYEGFDLLGDRPPRPFVFSQRVVRKHRWGDGLKFSLTAPRWKYYHLTEGDDELYDMVQDPAESTNVIRQQPQLAERLSGALLDMIQSYQQTRRDAGGDSGLSADVIEALESLGYVR